MRQLLILSLLLTMGMCNDSMAQFDQELSKSYEKYKESSITHRRFKHESIEKLVQSLAAPFRVETAGASIEGRNIYQVSIGDGPVTVLLWSQMHGDESTATMALMDMFNFFKASDQFDPLRRQLLKELTIVFVPMLNPDGAERFTRRNALGIDLNRDALRLQSPEAQLLKRVRDELEADWGFNLHDQSRYYAAGPNPNTATISFLAPAYNYEKEVNTIRGRSMQLIGLMNETLQQYIPGKVARYNDDFEPRAFGDNIQKWGTSTILIESGGLVDDPEKQEIRKLNFLVIMSALEAIAAKRYETADRAAYESIPFNDSGAFLDLALREVEIERNGNWYTVDIGIRRDETIVNGESVFSGAHIADQGDLSTYYAYENFPGKGFRAEAGKVYPKVLPDWAALQKIDPKELWRQGYTAVKMVNRSGEANRARHLEVLSEKGTTEDAINPYQSPGIILKKDGQVKYVVVKGRLMEL
ncbi:M14 family zinc carboxypeptidase [Flavilitoribacter nigricans]|uniref:Peptidase M14 n=1 Tax=Flavilitoribacter nigricans (strain ATCC 23147 / DSM 23189 / NBRC 102662 / NCIMB 1420 / SS-2) TaxID=1122177 RepID=A0A2D0NIH2_FLAN2|nr:M14 family zinc carboxypeptidase [Flavilitoribacter nigricans]PHN08294.1 peptidase M14 [Flavilitoribacter nigricans DSM 23189 = NBRC 102662]